MRRWLLAGVGLTTLAAGLAASVVYTWRAPGPSTYATDFVVHGRFVSVANGLQDAGVVRRAWVLRAYEAATTWQGAIRAAELSFPARASIETVLSILRHGRPVQHLVTIPEGVTSARVGQVLAGSAFLEGEIVLPREGAFLPESYAFVRGSSAGALLARGEADMSAEVARAWAGRTPELMLRSARELVVLASLVERETHLPAERSRVAAVFLNRLKLGMRLQSDPTIVYAASGGGSELAHGIRRDELAASSPYNTYERLGLPGGAICNPGAASIEAAAHPARSNALYFVADGTGGHAFADSLEEHARNVARYRSLAR